MDVPTIWFTLAFDPEYLSKSFKLLLYFSLTLQLPAQHYSPVWLLREGCMFEWSVFSECLYHVRIGRGLTIMKILIITSILATGAYSVVLAAHTGMPKI